MRAITVLLATLLVGCAQAQGPGRMADEADVGRAFQDWINAWTGENVEGVVGAMTPDAVVYDPAGSFRGRDAIRGWVSTTFEEVDGLTIAIQNASLRVAGHTAWVTGSYELRTSTDGPAVERGHLSMLWLLGEDGSYASPLFHASLAVQEGEDGEDGEDGEAPGG